MTDRADAVLHAAAARISVGETTAVAELTLCTRGDRVLLLGDTEALMAAITGVPLGAHVPRLSGGSLAVAGHDVATGAHRVVAGLAAFDPPLPMDWIVAEYLIWHARLGGASKAAAKTLARDALVTLELLAMATRPLSSTSLVQRRAVVLASALLGKPPLLVLDKPLDGLDEAAAGWLLELLARATADCSAIVSASNVRPNTSSGRLASTATDICLLRAGVLLTNAEPAELLCGAKMFEVTVRHNAGALRDALATRGLELQGGPCHFSLTVPDDMCASDILVAASEARATVVSCVPLLG